MEMEKKTKRIEIRIPPLIQGKLTQPSHPQGPEQNALCPFSSGIFSEAQDGSYMEGALVPFYRGENSGAKW